jgi:serine/threonine protein kinase
VPVLLPSLAFHDLVFGRELGAGTFSVVRHALRIVRGAPQASWPQYAVKVVSTAVMAELGYGAAVRREVAVLARLAHPNVARLVSAFRWRDGVHLVLEYAPRGDLHTTLTALGSLDEASTRFLAAEVAAALAAVHAAGFAFGDVKPENIVLVEDARGGVHAKLTDFGACRPINAEGFKLLADSTHILENLRDGDWRAAAGLVEQKPQSGAEPSVPSSAGSDSMDVEGPGQAEDTDMDQSDDNEDAEDERIEGTEEYLSPELASRAGRPSVASDAYALGITIYQCLTGRLPDTALIWPPPDNAGSGSGRRVRFGGGSAEAAFPSDFPAAAAELVKAMLHPDPAQRLGGGVRGILEVLDHPWFASALGPADDVVGTLHSRPGPSIAAGTAGPTADPAWSRRHNSTIWAPLPKQYSVSGSDPAAGAGAVAARPSKAAESFTLRELVAVEILPIIGVDKSAKP